LNKLYMAIVNMWSLRIYIIDIDLPKKKKTSDTVAVTGEECLHLISDLSRGFVDFFLISKLQRPPPAPLYTQHTADLPVKKVTVCIYTTSWSEKKIFFNI
jgi:hypothetical protein